MKRKMGADLGTTYGAYIGKIQGLDMLIPT